MHTQVHVGLPCISTSGKLDATPHPPLAACACVAIPTAIQWPKHARNRVTSPTRPRVREPAGNTPYPDAAQPEVWRHPRRQWPGWEMGCERTREHLVAHGIGLGNVQSCSGRLTARIHKGAQISGLSGTTTHAPRGYIGRFPHKERPGNEATQHEYISCRYYMHYTRTHAHTHTQARAHAR